jgi:hypothetical protein
MSFSHWNWILLGPMYMYMKFKVGLKYTLLTEYITDWGQKPQVCIIRPRWQSPYLILRQIYIFISILALTTGNPVYLISTHGSRRVWPVSRGCLLLHNTWSYHRICRRSVLPYTRFCNCILNYDCVLHIVNFTILYWKSWIRSKS